MPLCVRAIRGAWRRFGSGLGGQGAREQARRPYVSPRVRRYHTIAEMDFRSTHTMLHEQAIYQHEGEQYQVERLDFENHKAFVRKVEPDYFTTAMTYTRVEVIDEDKQARESEGALSGLGEVSV